MRNELIRFLESKRNEPEFERLVFITGDLGFSVVEPLQEILGPRFINAGIAEALMVSIAAGLASEGYKVYVYSIVPFATFRCLEQIRNDVCYHDLDVTIVGIGAGYGYGTLGPTHHATEDLAALAAIPNITVFNPGELHEAHWSFEVAWKTKGPKYLRLSKGGDKELTSGHPISIDSCWEVKPGKSFAVVTTGTVLPDVFTCLTSNSQLDEEFQLISVPVMKPFPTALVAKIAGIKPLICVSELNPNGGLEGQLAKVSRLNKNEILASREASEYFASTPGSAEYQKGMLQLSVVALKDFFETTRTQGRLKIE